MNFSHFQGRLRRGQLVEVELDHAANVRLLDDANFNAYCSGRSHRAAGASGYVKRSPHRLVIPRDGTWHVVVDLGGHAGRVRSKVRVLPGLLPTAPTSVPSLASIQAGVAEVGSLPEAEREFDVFISHASEDKDSVVRPLAHELRSLGLSVWYDEFELRIGDSLRRKIDGGLANSRFGVVVLSQAFFAKNWPQYELDGLVTREMSGQQVVLPIWHNISKDEIIARSPSLADKVALSTSIRTVGEIAAEIRGVIRQPNAA